VNQDLNELENKLVLNFKNKDILREAITHRSYLNENPSWKISHNERLEFLGDAVLELIVTEILFEQFPDFPEGKLTSLRAALVNYQQIAKVAYDLELEKFILLSKGEASDKGRARDAILADATEALIGAIYLDAGYGEAKRIIKKFIIERYLDEIFENGTYRDSKSYLQELAQENLKLTPIYRVLEEDGPDHQKIFTVGVYFSDKLIARGKGYSKQEAEIEAAKSALETFPSKFSDKI